MERRIQIDPVFCLLLAGAILLIPLRWLAAWLVAVAVHEAFHITTILLLGGDISRFQLGAGGAYIHTAALSPVKELIASLAGPVGSLLLLFAYRYAPLVALCGCIQGFFNLLPLYPLDGGRVLLCLLVRLLGGAKGESTSRVVGLLICVLILALGILCSRVSLLPLTAGLLLVAKRGKIPCKTLAKRVQ